MILSNPPYHTDFSVAKMFIEKGFNRLSIGGRMYMVTKRKEWYRNKLKSIFGGVRIWELNGYFVFMSIKKSRTYAKSQRRGMSCVPKEKERIRL
jgi:16S rRNA (guanine1207-N2)-methyltransferase